MKVIVTCGPSYEPIDQVRRITNASSGELGSILSADLAAAGIPTICCRGTGATHAAPGAPVEVIDFTTNDSLLKILEDLLHRNKIAAIFHVAALSDFHVESARDGRGHVLREAKIDSQISSVTLHLEPARKIIPELRTMIPAGFIIGWKYELSGSKKEALQRARRQIVRHRTDGCVLNGEAYGPGFGFCAPTGETLHFQSKPDLSAFLVKTLQARVKKV
jgi:phosphopantothenate---cysteine ligase (CTP)